MMLIEKANVSVTHHALLRYRERANGVSGDATVDHVRRAVRRSRPLTISDPGWQLASRGDGHHYRINEGMKIIFVLDPTEAGFIVVTVRSVGDFVKEQFDRHFARWWTDHGNKINADAIHVAHEAWKCGIRDAIERKAFSTE